MLQQLLAVFALENRLLRAYDQGLLRSWSLSVLERLQILQRLLIDIYLPIGFQNQQRNSNLLRVNHQAFLHWQEFLGLELVVGIDELLLDELSYVFHFFLDLLL